MWYSIKTYFALIRETKYSFLLAKNLIPTLFIASESAHWILTFKTTSIKKQDAIIFDIWCSITHPTLQAIHIVTNFG